MLRLLQLYFHDQRNILTTVTFLSTQLMDCDLHQIIQSKQSLSDMHHKCFAKQMLEGIKAMHDIGVFRKS